MIKLIQPFGDAAILLTFGAEINTGTNNEIVNYVKALKNIDIQGVLEVIPAYVSITVQYDFLKISYKELSGQLQVLDVEKVFMKQSRIIEIPVCYDATLSIDMEEVVSYTGMTREEVINKHTSKDYLVYMLGFTPGFFYLGGIDPRLFCPRKDTPRLEIEAGSVGIAGTQTGVYSLGSPGGWQIIGKTPLSIFDKNRKEDVFLVNQGDTVQFYEISLEEFKQYHK
tara:strand:- start:6178 stop:6852 length:675 start_codon:yes stop_codon:yes gene_type:complete